jgi:hypothetical protein
MVWSKAIKLAYPVGALALVVSLTINHAALALTADLAKKCREMMVKEFPPHTAGSSTGSAQQERSYFQACIAQGGKMDSPATTEGRGGK